MFSDPFAHSVMDRIENGEERWQTVGLVNGTWIVLVAHTLQWEGEEEIIRVISARKLSKKERYRYEHCES